MIPIRRVALAVTLAALGALAPAGPSALLGGARPLAAQHRTSPEVQARVDSIVARMTLEEKVGQMTQIDINQFVADPAHPVGPDGKVRLDPRKLREGIVQRHIGSILNVPGEALSMDAWHDVVRQIQDVATR